MTPFENLIVLYFFLLIANLWFIASNFQEGFTRLGMIFIGFVWLISSIKIYKDMKN
jgi:uncharacterized protein YqhQ